ncbi:hypothetical protein [Halalkalibacter flavus]|uniref:hypothetical protein n=1 Tax=Halalkalibacter flavus TaxID=3090668 RepID=UPI002FC8A4BC
MNFMKVFKDNLIEIFLLIGLSLISIGFFIWSSMAGFIVTGLLFMGLAFITFTNKGGD